MRIPAPGRSARLLVVAGLLLLPSLPGGARADSTDLRKVYRATLDNDEASTGLDWACGPEDVWEIASFGFRVPGRFEVAIGPGTATFGHHGTDALWAVVVPKEPGRMQSSEGGEEKVVGIWMRFHPAIVGDLFPARTVRGNGDPKASYWARRVCEARINDCWQYDASPVVPTKRSVVIDADTSTGGRHMFMVDTKDGDARHYGGTAVPAPPAAAMEPAEALKAFDGSWEEFDRTYAKFGIRPEVNWDALRARYRPIAGSSRTAWEAANAVALLLSHLRDLHVWVTVGGEPVPVYRRPRAWNGNWKATQALLPGRTMDPEADLEWSRTKDGIGYIVVSRLERKEVVAAFDEALERLADAWALVVDLRWNGGGGEDLALEMAGRIVDRERVYAVNRYRSGRKRDDLGPRLERRCPPRGPWRWASPAAVLVGQRTFSSAESFSQMLAVCPDVVSVGDRTAGSSANPRTLSLPGGITVNVPRWNDMAPDGTPLEDAGVAPEVPVKASSRELESRDPVLEAALARLRKAPRDDRRPGKRER